jgi:uncharacterized protein (DUF1697 family)
MRVQTYIALLRAVNVGGTGKLPMSALKAICADAKFADVRTYIASGNAIFASRFTEAHVKQELEMRLRAYAGKPVGVLVRTRAEMAAVLAANPFRQAAPNRTYTVFLDAPPTADALALAHGQSDEILQLGLREIYIQYPSGMGPSKLRIPAAASGTARNMNTVAKLAEMAGAV